MFQLFMFPVLKKENLVRKLCLEINPDVNAIGSDRALAHMKFFNGFQKSNEGGGDE